MTMTTMTNENESKRTKCGDGVEFNPEQHEYKKNGVIIPSVTTIIRQVFGYKYGAVSPEVLERARAKGTEVHLEAEEYHKYGTIGISDEFFALKKEFDRLPKPLAVEDYLYAETPSGAFCGTCDLFYGSGRLCDYKTSKVLDAKTTTIQLNMYRYAYQKAGYDVSNLEAWHVVGNVLKRVQLPILPDSYIEGIVDYYYSGKQADEALEALKETNQVKRGRPAKKEQDFARAAKQLAAIDEKMELLQAKKDLILQNIKEFMALKNIDKAATDLADFTYIPEATRTSFDSAKFKKDRPDVYGLYLKTSTTKAQVRVRFKTNEKQGA